MRVERVSLEKESSGTYRECWLESHNRDARAKRARLNSKSAVPKSTCLGNSLETTRESYTRTRKKTQQSIQRGWGAGAARARDARQRGGRRRHFFFRKKKSTETRPPRLLFWTTPRREGVRTPPNVGKTTQDGALGLVVDTISEQTIEIVFQPEYVPRCVGE